MEENLYNLAFERSILSSIIFEPSQFDDIETRLKVEDFYLPAHQDIYASLKNLVAKDLPIDEEFIKNDLQAKKKFDENVLIEILSANPIANTKAYVDEMKDKALKRHLLTLTTEIKRVTIEEQLPSTEVVDIVERKLYEITQDNQTSDFKDSPTMTHDTMKYIEEMKARGNSVLVGVDTGFTDLNKMTTGFGKGDLVIIAARPAMGKCLGLGTKVVMYDGTLKSVEDVQVGDQLMGDDSTPRNVLSLARGREMMYYVRQERGIDYRVNESHILSLQTKSKDIYNMNIETYLSKSKKEQKKLKGYRVELDFKELPLEIEAYSAALSIAKERKNIPHEYIVNSRHNRLQFLAGLVDAIGDYDKSLHVIEFFEKDEAFVKEIKYLTDTLGFISSYKRVESLDGFHLKLQGKIEKIPTKVFKIKKEENSQKLQTKIRVEKDCVDDYYGFEIDGNHLFLLEDMTVTHNTSFALNTVLNLLTQNKGVAFFSLEMPAEQLMLRLLSMHTSIQLQNLRVGNMDDAQWSRLNDSVKMMNNAKLFVDDQGSVNINQLRSKLRKLKGQHPEIEIAFIDYLQIMEGTGNKDRHQQVSDISRGLKMLARELEMPVVALSQLNRGLESRNDKRPMLSDIRESGAIEQDADIILFVYRDDVYLYKEEKEREKAAKAAGVEFKSNYVEREEEGAEIIIGKQRNGPTGHVKLTFQKKFTRFVDGEPQGGYGGPEVVYENVQTTEAHMNVSSDQMNSKVDMPVL